MSEYCFQFYVLYNSVTECLTCRCFVSTIRRHHGGLGSREVGEGRGVEENRV